MSDGCVIVLGSINVDLVVRTPRLPCPGETVLGGEFYRAAGGKGANQAVAAARLSRQPVTFIAAVGDDDFGRESLRLFGEENMDCRWVRCVAGESTGVALILVDERGENLIGVASGANLHLRPDDVIAAADETFSAGGVFAACLESPLATVASGLQAARERGLTTILNPAPGAIEIATPEVLGLVDVLTPNESEAALLTGIETSTREGCQSAADRLRELGCSRVIVTRGREGCLLVDEAGIAAFATHRVDAVDATAAGDAFNGALAVALAEGREMRGAIELASGAAALSVTRRGAQPSLPTRAAVERFLSQRTDSNSLS